MSDYIRLYKGAMSTSDIVKSLRKSVVKNVTRGFRQKGWGTREKFASAILSAAIEIAIEKAVTQGKIVQLGSAYKLYFYVCLDTDVNTKRKNSYKNYNPIEKGFERYGIFMSMPYKSRIITKMIIAPKYQRYIDENSHLYYKDVRQILEDERHWGNRSIGRTY